MKTRDEIHSIITEYRDNHARVIDLAKTYGMTRQGIYKLLKAHKVETAKSQRVVRTCYACGANLIRHRSMARKTKHSFCSLDCYGIYMETLKERHNPSKFHSRMATKNVLVSFPEYNPTIHAIHFVDGDNEHYHAKNLEVYGTVEEHLRVHAGQKVEPIWRGQ
jgi:hypothetical protein